MGLHNSHGEFLAFLDADDVWLPHKLEHQVELMRQNPEAGLVYGPSQYWYDWDVDRVLKEENCIPGLAPGGKLYLPPTLLINSHPFGSYDAPCPSSFLLRHGAFRLVGGFVESFNPDTYQLYEDTAFLTKIYLNVPVFVGESCLDRYRCARHPCGIASREPTAKNWRGVSTLVGCGNICSSKASSIRRFGARFAGLAGRTGFLSRPLLHD